MDVPEVVASAVGDEDVVAHVPLRGEDAMYVTSTRTLLYTGDGLLSDASVAEFGHDAERVSLATGRRKATLTLDYGLDGERSFAVPAKSVDEVLHPVLAGVLHAAGVTDPGETVKRTYRFSELTLVVTSARLVKHIGNAVWDDDYEEIPYADVTGIDVEEGTVAAQLVLQTPTHTERIKTPADRLRDVREHVEEALFAFHDVPDRDAFERSVADAQAAAEADDSDGTETDDGPGAQASPDAGTSSSADTFLEDGLAPLSTSSDETDDTETGSAAGRPAESRSPAGDPAAPESTATADEPSGPEEHRGTATDTPAPSPDAAESSAPSPDVSDSSSTAASDTSRQSGSTDVTLSEVPEDDLAQHLRDLEAAIERQEALLAEQRALLEDVSRALSRDR